MPSGRRPSERMVHPLPARRIAAALPRVLEKIEVAVATAGPAETMRLRQRADAGAPHVDKLCAPKLSSQLTLCWSKVDSNSGSHREQRGHERAPLTNHRHRAGT